MLSELRPEVVAAAKASFRAVWDAGSRIARNRHHRQYGSVFADSLAGVWYNLILGQNKIRRGEPFMKKSTWYRDLLVMLAALCVAGVAVVWVQRITGRIDGVAMLIFMLAVFVTSMYTDGYLWGVLASLASVLAVNFAFFTPYFAFNFTLPENLFSRPCDAGRIHHDQYPDHPGQKTGAAAHGDRAGKNAAPTFCGRSPTTCARPSPPFTGPAPP